MQKREQELLRLLRSKKDWLTAAQLASALSCSVRTVKNCVAGLNQRWPGLILSSHKGFCLCQDPNLLQQVRQEDRRNPIPQDTESRRSYILRKLLLEQEYYDLDALSKELCIAPTTMVNELSKLRPTLLNFGLHLRTKSNRLFILGPDDAKKQLMSWLIYQDAKDFLSNIQLVNEYFPDISLITVRNVITGSLRQHGYFLSDYSLSLLVLNVAVSLERNLRHFDVQENSHCHKLTIPPSVQQAVDDFCSILEQKFAVELHSGDRYNFSTLLLTRGVQQTESSDEVVEQPTRSLALFLCARVREVYGLDLNAYGFPDRFALHLKNLLLRLYGQVELRNPHLVQIKKSSPYVYDMAVFLAFELAACQNIHLPEDEIAFLALHIGETVERLYNTQRKIHALLLYPGYYYDGMALLQHIARTFEDSLDLQALISSPDELADHPDCTLLLSNVPVSAPVDTVQIGNFFDTRDAAALAAQIHHTQQTTLRNALHARLPALFSPTLFWYAPSFTDRENAIRTMGDTLEKLGYVPAGYSRDVANREAISSTALATVAMPHTFEANALRTVVAVSVCPQPLPWAGNRVHLILMMAVHKDDRPLLQDFLHLLRELLVQPPKLRVLHSAKTCDAFVSSLLSIL